MPSFGARWIFPVDQPPLRESSITIVDGFIASLNPRQRANADHDLGDVAIIPGFVNAHTHLEFSDLTEPLGQTGMPITDWIPLVIHNRILTNRKPSEIEISKQSLAAIQCGLQESHEVGTVAIGEIATSPWFQSLPVDDLFLSCFVELLGRESPDERIDTARQWLDIAADNPCQLGISPHAPYSMSDPLFEASIRWAIDSHLPVAMHLAESREELRWLKSGDGPFLDLLESISKIDSRPNQKRPLDYLRALAKTEHAIVVHGNYLADDELNWVGNHSNMHIAYCPRTHQFFQHEKYPLQKILDRGINVAVGTDSRASNPDLNVLSELKSIRTQFPNISGDQLLKMGTLNGARALQQDHLLGSLTPGKSGHFNSIELSDLNNPLESLFDLE